MMYVELKSGFSHDGPAWIGRVRFSQTGRTIYYRGKTLKRLNGSVGNFVDAETGDEYWVSHVARDGIDRHWTGAGPVQVDDDVRTEYLDYVHQQVRSPITKIAVVVLCRILGLHRWRRAGGRDGRRVCRRCGRPYVPWVEHVLSWHPWGPN
jgi:hypothetical protein